jgi:Ca2+:H+ antiporter
LAGLLNATFGNAVEMILTIQTLLQHQFTVVKATLLGSILSNLLLVLGCSMLAGGFKKQTQTFSKESASANVSLLLLAATSLALTGCFLNLPEVVTYNVDTEGELSLKVSRVVSLIVLCCYLAFLFFTFVTHKGTTEEDHEEPSIKPWLAMLLLALTTVLVALSSELLVDAIDGIVSSWGIPKAFIGMILLPIVGNACEHFGAVKFAMQDQMDLTIGIAVGSATQMALFVVPFAVLMGWALHVSAEIPNGGGPPRGMDLDFGILNTIIMCASVLLAFSILNDGGSNWLEGFMLIASYLIVATLYWFFPATD